MYKSNIYPQNLFFIVILFSALVYFFQSVDSEIYFLSGLVVPDVFSHSEAIYAHIDTYGLRFWEAGHVYWGMILLYGFVIYFAPKLIIIINLLLLYGVYKYSIKLMLKMADRRSHLVALFIALNPYFLLVASGINKEIPLALLTLMFMLVYLQGRFFVSLLIVGAMYLFRDGYAVAILCFIVLDKAWKLDKRLGVFSLFLCALLVSRIYPVLAEYMSIFARNAGSAFNSFSDGEDKSDFIAHSIPELSYLYRLLGNLVSLSVRPRFLNDNNTLYMLGFAYHFVGVQIIGSYIAIISVMLSKGYKYLNNETRIVLVFALTMVIMLSISLYIQPRYLFVISPILIVAVYCLSLSYRRLNLVMAVSFFFVFFVFNLLLFVLGIHPTVEVDNMGQMSTLF